MKQKTLALQQIYREGTACLKEAGIADAAQDAWHTPRASADIENMHPRLHKLKRLLYQYFCILPGNQHMLIYQKGITHRAGGRKI